MEYFEKIKQLRLKNNITQEKLAELTGYNDRSSIAKIERGKVDISQSKLELFANVLGCTPAYLLGWDESPESTNENEKKLISIYRGLNDEGKYELMKQARLLDSVDIYKNECDISKEA